MGIVDMKTLLAMFALITVSCAGDDLVVSQPSSAQGTEGGSARLYCSYISSSESTVGSYRWVKDPELEVRNTTQEFRGRVTGTTEQDFISKRRADIRIQDLRQYDAGIYRCMVSIYGLKETSGNGTELRVKKAASGSPRGSQDDDDHMSIGWMFVRGLLYTLGIVIVAVMTCHCSQKTTSQKKVQMQKHSRENETKMTVSIRQQLYVD